ncbi:immunoglobulin-binding protein 1 [Melanotaenia boesemani]|uniref:immunoglobulin-binding protein 1 n=1 Tax=Melanotaenia boesemani TaxID=1250792 RepID=UPI001C046A30|nr:immunoglobulin-binding protein 1 [Melanotaenia boesemani]
MAESCNGAPQPLTSDAELGKLPDLLERGWKIFEEVDGTSEPLGSSSVQVRVKRAISMLEEASRMVAQLDLFSRNEELEEISTADLKYLLLPALLGALHMKQTSRDKRLEIVQTARVYFLDFLRRCNDYSIAQVHLPESAREDTPDEDSSDHGCPKAQSVPAGPSDLVAMAAKRQSKIERYRQRKDLEARLSDVRRMVESGQADDEVSRDFYLLNVRRWVTVCLEEVESIDQEVEILRNMDVLKQGPSKHPTQPARQPMKPFILTRDAVQAQVFGAGYPSLPTMTVDDWYEQHTKHGALPDQGVPRRVAVEDDADAQERAEEDKEQRAENDEQESLQKARDWDEWKDSHRRGYGNRQNMG